MCVPDVKIQIKTEGLWIIVIIRICNLSKKAYIYKLNVWIYSSLVALNVAHSSIIKSKYDSFYYTFLLLLFMF